MTTQDALLELMRVSLWGGQVSDGFSLTADQWHELFLLSGNQSVQGVAFDALQNLPKNAGLPLSLAGTWMRETSKIETDYARMSAVVAKQKETWSRHSVNAVLLKGLESSKYYPVPQHRVCGDIDWWLPAADDWDKAIEVVKNNGLEMEMDSDGDIAYSLAGVVVEHHRKGLATDGPIGELVLLNEHVLHHAMVSGIGLRQVYDYALAKEYWAGKYDMVEYRHMLSSKALLKWTGLLDEVIDTVLKGEGVPSKNAVRFMSLVWMDGNFGFGKQSRFGGFWSRAVLFMRYVPAQFVSRWTGLLVGRLRFSRVRV